MTVVFTLALMLYGNEAIAQLPPFSTITISGIAKLRYDKISLFEGGSATTPR